MVIAQLTQYRDFLKSAFPELKGTCRFPALLANGVDTLGLSTGTLGVFVVACSSTLEELYSHGKTAVRLAMLLCPWLIQRSRRRRVMEIDVFFSTLELCQIGRDLDEYSAGI